MNLFRQEVHFISPFFRAAASVALASLLLAAIGAAERIPGPLHPAPFVTVSPHLYEIQIQLLREIGDEADALILLRKQFRLADARDEAEAVFSPNGTTC